VPTSECCLLGHCCAVCCAELMVVDALLAADPVLGISRDADERVNKACSCCLCCAVPFVAVMCRVVLG
jgi:hypothetical protein